MSLLSGSAHTCCGVSFLRGGFFTFNTGPQQRISGWLVPFGNSFTALIPVAAAEASTRTPRCFSSLIHSEQAGGVRPSAVTRCCWHRCLRAEGLGSPSGRIYLCRDKATPSPETARCVPGMWVLDRYVSLIASQNLCVWIWIISFLGWRSPRSESGPVR